VTRAARLLELAKRIVSIEHELALLRSEFARLADSSDSAIVEREAPFSRPTLQSRVQSELNHAGRGMRAGELATLLVAREESVCTALSKLVKVGTVLRVERGLYLSATHQHATATPTTHEEPSG
jgi:hypothetical protein